MNNIIEEKVQKIIILLLTAFKWNETEEGMGYWSEVDRNLNKLINIKPVKLCARCSEEIKNV